jgi:hypothetical protein
MVSNQPSPSRRKGRLLCGAKTRAGGCCQVRAEPGKTRCRFHGGKSTGPKTQAGRARIAKAQRHALYPPKSGPFSDLRLVPFGGPSAVPLVPRLAAEGTEHVSLREGHLEAKALPPKPVDLCSNDG